MHRLLLLCSVLCFSAGLLAQPLYVEQFDDGVAQQQSTDSWTISEADGELLITGLGTKGLFDGIWFDLGGQIDITASPKVYIRGRASDFDSSIRMDLVDGNDNFSNVAPIEVFLTNDDVIYEFDFSAVDVGEVDLTTIKALYAYINPNQASWTAQIALDYISIGESIDGPITSDIYQDLMDSDSSLASFAFASDGYAVARTTGEEGDSTVIRISGDGSSAQWTLLVYQLRPGPEFIQTEVDMTNNTKVYIKAKSRTEGTTLRVDIQDTDNISSNKSAKTNVLTEEFAVYEYDYAGAEGIPVAGTNCTEDNAPCILNLAAIKELLI